MVVDETHVEGIGGWALGEPVDEEIAVVGHGVGGSVDAIDSGDHEIEAVVVGVDRGEGFDFEGVESEGCLRGCCCEYVLEVI